MYSAYSDDEEHKNHLDSENKTQDSEEQYESEIEEQNEFFNSDSQEHEYLFGPATHIDDDDDVDYPYYAPQAETEKQIRDINEKVEELQVKSKI